MLISLVSFALERDKLADIINEKGKNWEEQSTLMNLWIQRNNKRAHSIPLKLKPVTTGGLKSKLVALEYYAKSTAIVNAINRTQWWLRPLPHTSQYYDNNNNIFILASKILLKKKNTNFLSLSVPVPITTAKFHVYNFSFFILNFDYLSSQNKIKIKKPLVLYK